MNDPVPIRLYEDPNRPPAQHPGPYRPAEPDGWDHAVGDDLSLEDAHGGYLIGTILDLDPQPHAEADGARYRIATVRLKD